MTLLRHFDYTPDQADASVRFELRNQEPRDDAEARVALTVVDLESDGDEDQGSLTVELSPRDVEGLIEALEQTLDELEPREGEEEEEEEAEQPEPQPPSRRAKASKDSGQDEKDSGQDEKPAVKEADEGS
jgi:hypothetical protein